MVDVSAEGCQRAFRQRAHGIVTSQPNKSTIRRTANFLNNYNMAPSLQFLHRVRPVRVDLLRPVQGAVLQATQPPVHLQHH